MLEQLKMAPVLTWKCAREGTGACVLMGLAEAAVKILGEMATFESAGVEKNCRERFLRGPAVFDSLPRPGWMQHSPNEVGRSAIFSPWSVLYSD